MIATRESILQSLRNNEIIRAGDTICCYFNPVENTQINVILRAEMFNETVKSMACSFDQAIDFVSTNFNDCNRISIKNSEGYIFELYK